LFFFDFSFHQSNIVFLDLAAFKLGLEMTQGSFVLGNDHRAGGVFVEAMDNAGAHFAADSR
jgi:hypothetical protein